MPTVLLAWLGCPFVTNGDLTEVRDADGDGFVSDQFGGDDCDDHQKRVHPGARDVWYDGRIRDCDRTDDFDRDLDGVPWPTDCDDRDSAVGEPVAWYPDRDEDGLGGWLTQYGVEASEPNGTSCSGPEGWVSNADDCDDANAEVGTSQTFYRDHDHDGYGDRTKKKSGCAWHWGWALDDTDCDDDDFDRRPGAVLYADLDGDTYGDPLNFDQSCDPRAEGVPFGEDCDDTDPNVYPGAYGEVMADGVDTDCFGGTEIDFDGDFLPDLLDPTCTTVTFVPIQPYGMKFDLQPAIDSALDCSVVEVANGEYGPVVITDKSIALVAAPGAHPVLTPAGLDPAITVVGVARGLTLEGLAFSGAGAAVSVPADAFVLASGLLAEDGDGFVVTPLDPEGDLVGTGSIDVYDSLFDQGTSAVSGDLMAHVHLVRVTVDNSLAVQPLVTGGSADTWLEGVEIRHSAVLGAAIEIPNGALHATDLVLEDVFAVALHAALAPTAPSEIDGLTIVGAATPDRWLVHVENAAPLDPASIVVRDLVVTDSIWQADAAVLAGAGFVMFDGVGLDLERATFRENLYLRDGPVLANTQPLLPLPMDVEMRNVAILGAIDGIALADATLENATFADVAEPLDLAGSVVLDSLIFQDCTTLSLNVAATVTWANSIAYRCPSPDPLVLDVDPRFLRYHPNLDPALWDTRVAPDSPAIDAGTAGRFDPDGSPCDIGATGGPGGSSEEDADLDGLYDSWELQFFDALDVTAGGLADSDYDGRTDTEEFGIGTLPNAADTDGDGAWDTPGDDQEPLDPFVQ